MAVYFRGHTYELVEQGATFSGAAAAARAAGGHLAIIGSGAENDVVFDLASSSDRLDGSTAPDGGRGLYVWLGGTDAESEQDWTWLDGTSVDDGFDVWGSGPAGQEPDDFGDEQDGLAMGLSVWPNPSGGIGIPGEWNDVSVTNRLFYVIEYDALLGSSKADTLKGAAGDDVIEGRGGRDRLTGGKGEDVFVYESTAHSAKAKTADLITDFKPGEDLIDLSAIDSNANTAKNNAFRFRGEDLAPTKAGDLWVTVKAGQTTLFGDVDGDQNADFVIRLTGALDLTRDDFML